MFICGDFEGLGQFILKFYQYKQRKIQTHPGNKLCIFHQKRIFLDFTC